MEKITDHQWNVQSCRCDTGFASTNLETGSSLAGISVALNNYYAGNAQPEKKLASSYDQLEATAKNNSSGTKAAAETKAAASATSNTKAETKAQTSSGAKAETKAAAPKETKAAASQTKAASSSYDNIAVSKVSGSVNIRTEANTTSLLQERYTMIVQLPFGHSRRGRRKMV